MNLYLWASLGSLIPVLLLIIRETKDGKLPESIFLKGFWIAQLCKMIIALLTYYFMQDYFPDSVQIKDSLLAVACGYAGADILGALLNMIVKLITPKSKVEVMSVSQNPWYNFL